MDLDTITKMDICISGWKYPKQGACFKERCFEVLLNRLKSIGCTVSNGEHCRFEDFIMNRLKTFEYTNLQVYSATIDALNQMLPHTDPNSIFITLKLLYEGIIDKDGSLIMDKEELDTIAEDIINELPDYSYEFGDLFIEKDEILRAISAYQKVYSGDFQGALLNHTVEEMAAGFSDLFVSALHCTEIVTPEQVLQCLPIFLDVFDMNEAYSCKIHAYCSKEIYWYMKKYREQVPHDIRKVIDTFVDVIACPIHVNRAFLVDYKNIWDDENEKFIVIIECLEDSCDEEIVTTDEGDFIGVWKSAFLTLDNMLPKLREKYERKVA